MKKAFVLILGALVAASAGLLLFYEPARFAAEFHLNKLIYSDRPEALAVKVCKDELLRDANDPGSVEWIDDERWVTRVKYTTTDGNKAYETRMELRAKNRLGALVKSTLLCESSVSNGYGFVVALEHAN